MVYEMNIRYIYGILIISLSLLVDCEENSNLSSINGSIPKLESDNRDNNHDKNNSSVTTSFTRNSTCNSIIATSEKNEVMTTAKPTEWFGGLIRRPTALDDVDSKSELLTTTSSSKETTTPFTGFSTEFLQNSTHDVELSCKCVPYYQCDSKEAILDPQKFQNDTPKVRLEIKNCNITVFDVVCCLRKDLSKTKSENIPESSESGPSTHLFTGNTADSTTELSTKAGSSMSGTEKTTHFIDSLVALMRNSNQTEVELSCTCVPYYQCDPDKSILDPHKLQNDKKTPKIRLEMENCSNMSLIEVCCLGLEVQESLEIKSKQLDIGHPIVGNSDSTTESVEGVSTEWNSNIDMETTTSFDDFLIELLRNSSQQDVVLACTCAPYYRCDPNNIIVPQLQNDAVTPKVRVEMENCSRELSEVCCLKNATIIVDSKTSVETADRCGIRNLGGIGNQSSEVDFHSDYGEFPWVAAILLKTNNNGYRYHCSGSLIDRNVILTSAHCIAGRKESDIKIRVGEWDTRNSEEFFPHQDYFLEKIIVHKEFNLKNLHNDIAILILDRPLNYHIHIGRICLPQSNSKYTQFPANATCFSTGWGKNSFDSESLYHVVPKKASLKLIEHDKCQELLRNSRLSQHFNLHESFICAHDNDTCSGDGGSPLMCSFDSEPGVYQLVGMVAWGLGCGALYPSVYVDVARFRTWISDELKHTGIETILL